LPGPLPESTIAAKEEVITTRLTVGALFLIDRRIPIVPLIAAIPQKQP
jgi:hypothetical protein